MSTANTALNCLFCFSNISNVHLQQQNQKNLTPSDVISCCNKHLSKEFIDRLIWTNASSAVGSLCQECYDIVENLNSLNVNLNKIIDDINKLGSLLSFRISAKRRNYELSTTNLGGFSHRCDTNQQDTGLIPHTAPPPNTNKQDWNYEVENLHEYNQNQNQKDCTTATTSNSFSSVTPITGSFDDSNESYFGDPNAAADHAEKCQLSQRKPRNGNNKSGLRQSSVNDKEIGDRGAGVGKAVSKEDEIVTGSELQRHLQNGSDAGFKCDKCNKIFSRLTILQRHDCSKPTYECEVCQKSFSGTGVLKLHMRSHTGERPYKCETCEKCFAVKCHLTAHIRTHSDDKPFKCTFCDKSFRDNRNLTNHMTTHKSAVVKKYKCDICSKFFGSLHYLKIHLQYHSEDRAEMCSICGKGFTNKNSLKYHEKRHSLNEQRSHKCHICGKGYPTIHSVKKHIQTHCKVKPFLCDECGQSFKSIFYLRQHSLIHTEKGPFKCDICNTVYQSSPSLKLHYDRTHSAKALKCERCDRAFGNKDLLKKHMDKMFCTKGRIRLDKPFFCTSCEMSFTTEEGRKSHQIKHLPIHERPSFLCEVCNTTFNHVTNLTRHHRKLHAGLPYYVKKDSVFCRICKRYFQTYLEFVKHKETNTEESIIRCLHCPEVFSSECEDTFHHRRVHAHENSSSDCKNCSMPPDTYFNGLAQTKKRRIRKPQCNEEEIQDSFSKRNYLTRMCKEKNMVDSENSKGSSSSVNDRSDNESESDSARDSFLDGDSSDIEIKIENDPDTEIKTEYNEYILP